MTVKVISVKERGNAAKHKRKGKESPVSYRMDEVTVDEAETKRMIEQYSGSALAQSRGWTDEYLKNHFPAVRAKYFIAYDRTKTSLDDGDIDRFFYLTEDTETGQWAVIDASTDGQPAAEESR